MEKKPFYLFKRKLKSGKKVYYWYTYNKGKRTTPQSTGCTKRNEAFNYCLSRIIKTGSVQVSNLTFEEFSRDWYTEGHEYTMYKKQKSSTLYTHRSILTGLIKPFFDEFELSELQNKDFIDFIENAKKNNYSDSYIRTSYSILKTMFKYAVEKEYINKNPMPKYMLLKSSSNRIAFSMDELKFIFNQKWQNRKIMFICLMGACTGMRISEILGLQEEQFKSGYIEIDRQAYKGNVQSTKTGTKRFVTIPLRLKDEIFSLRGSCFIFENSINKRMVFRSKNVYDELYSHYSEDMLKKKNENALTFHSFRYFFNTYLMSNDISQAKCDFVIGHSSGTGSMNRLYTTWKPEMYSDVLELQEKLLDDLNF